MSLNDACADFFVFGFKLFLSDLRNSGPAACSQPASSGREQPNRTRTVETADGLSRSVAEPKGQSGFRCAHRLLQIIDRGGGWQ